MWLNFFGLIFAVGWGRCSVLGYIRNIQWAVYGLEGITVITDIWPVGYADYIVKSFLPASHLSGIICAESQYIQSGGGRTQSTQSEASTHWHELNALWWSALYLASSTICYGWGRISSANISTGKACSSIEEQRDISGSFWSRKLGAPVPCLQLYVTGQRSPVIRSFHGRSLSYFFYLTQLVLKVSLSFS